MFFQQNGIRHITSPVANPQSNGQAENYVKIFKNKLKAALSDSENRNQPLSRLVSRFLIVYRNADHETTKKAPAELLLGRKLRTRFDLLKTSNKNQNATDAYNNIKRNKPNVI
ncbi:hypothetical protein JTB14_023626 [Gonioctena quinquepunctata]|nr:hypothetical protein JTB14_023626 [Gonioctena quinquepunctata]